MTVKVNEIYKDDCEELYVVREVFNSTCIVCPIQNKDCFACEIMEISSMERERWVRIGMEVD